MTKEQRKIKELTAQVETLTKQLEEEKRGKDYYSREYDTFKRELDEMHYTLDVLDVPRKAPGQMYDDLQLSARMTLFVAGVRASTCNKEN